MSTAPPVMKDAHTKLSKRNGDASYEDLVAAGYLKEAVLNYIALLGWSPGGEQEVFTLPELVQAFDISGISKSPSIFDTNKLRWLNGEYIRRLSPEAFYDMARPWLDKGIHSDSIDRRARGRPAAAALRAPVGNPRAGRFPRQAARV